MDDDGLPIIRMRDMICSVEERDRRFAAFFAEAEKAPQPVLFFESLETENESDSLPEGVESLAVARWRRMFRERRWEQQL